MRPFTFDMFNAYQKMKVVHNHPTYNEYMYAISQLSDESTASDYNEIKFLKELIIPYTNIEHTKSEQYKKMLLTDN